MVVERCSRRSRRCNGRLYGLLYFVHCDLNRSLRTIWKPLKTTTSCRFKESGKWIAVTKYGSVDVVYHVLVYHTVLIRLQYSVKHVNENILILQITSKCSGIRKKGSCRGWQLIVILCNIIINFWTGEMQISCETTLAGYRYLKRCLFAFSNGSKEELELFRVRMRASV